MFTKVCVQKGKNVIPLSTLPKVSSFSDLGEGKTGPVTLCPKRMLWECFPPVYLVTESIPTSLLLSWKLWVKELKLVKHTFPGNEASAEWQPPDLGIQAQSLHNSRTSWEGIDWSFLPTPLPAVPYPPSTRTNIAWKYKVLRINYCRTLNLVCFLVDCEESGLDQGSLTITEASGSQTWLRTRITWEFKKRYQCLRDTSWILVNLARGTVWALGFLKGP